MEVAEDVLAVLSAAQVTGRGQEAAAGVRLVGQLDRKLYERVDKTLRAAGGRWDRKTKLHLFERDPALVMDQIILTGQVVDQQREFGFFETPPDLVGRVHEAACLLVGGTVLEPSAGRGALVVGLRSTRHAVSCVEIQESLVEELNARLPAAKVLCADFLSVSSSWGRPGFDRILMNPPFARQADVRHVTHALSFLRPRRSSVLVAIMAAGISFRQDSLATSFRSLVTARGGTLQPLPDDSFKLAGTRVRTVFVTIPGTSPGGSP